MCRLIGEATGALVHLDANRLAELLVRAEAVLMSGPRLSGSAELQARHRMFAAVVRATSDNLAVLERAGSADAGFEAGYGAGRQWVR